MIHVQQSIKTRGLGRPRLFDDVAEYLRTGDTGIREIRNLVAETVHGTLQWLHHVDAVPLV